MDPVLSLSTRVSAGSWADRAAERSGLGRERRAVGGGQPQAGAASGNLDSGATLAERLG